jgi:hypothetical protein
MNQDNQKRTEWIDQYLLGQLEGEELGKFMQYMQSDAAFKREVEVQRAILLNLRKAGRVAARQQIVEIQERIHIPWPPETAQQAAEVAPVIQLSTPNTPKQVSYYAIAAAVTVLLVASLMGYFFYRDATSPSLAVNNSDSIHSDRPAVALIPLTRTRGSEELGFGGGDKPDTTITILIYKTGKRDRAYQFDDTLRLYGTFSLKQLSLQLDQKTGNYTLMEGGVPYVLQRYLPLQQLPSVR